MPRPPSYIVTGGAGFIGANLVAALLERTPRPRIVVLDNFRTGSFANLASTCARRGCGPFDGEVIPCSAGEADVPELLEALEPRAVFHLAAITDTTLADQAEMFRENSSAFSPWLHACADAEVPLVYASSAAVYGTPPQARDRVPFPVEAAGLPSNVYGFSKWLMECEHRRLAADAVEAGDKPPHAVGLRYFNVFGPGESCKGKMASMVYQLAGQMLSGHRPRLFTDGSQCRDQVYVDDAVDCTLAAAGLGARAKVQPGVYNLGSGQATSFNEIVAAIRGALGLSDRERTTEYFQMPADIRGFYQDYTCADLSATESGLGWKPRWKPADAVSLYARILRDERSPRG